MADTFTSKLGLRQYDATLNYAVSKFSADNLLIDNAIGTVICTSTTRPSTGLFNGMTLWETDTRRFVVRVAGAWTVVPNIVTIADATARSAIVTPYDGMMIYRQDRDWIEVYDGAAWRVQGTAVCSSTSDRDSAITSPYNGQLATTTDTGSQWQRQGGAWVGTFGTGGATVWDIQNTAGTTTSGAFTATLTGGTACGVAFTAPASGKIMVYNNCEVQNSAAPTLSLCTIRIRTGSTVGSGSDILAAANAEAIFGGVSFRAGTSRPLSGLTPGSLYNAQQLFAVGGGTGTYVNKSLIVAPA